MWTRILIISLAIWALTIFQKRLHANTPDSGYLVILRVETTSDWTDLIFNNTVCYYLKDTLLTVSDNQIEIGLLSIGKRPYDSSYVQAEFQILLPVNLPPKISFSIRKGDIGYTRVSFLTTGLFEDVLAKFLNDENLPHDPTNQKNFSLKRAIFEKIPKTRFVKPPKSKKTEPLVLAFYYPWYSDNWFLNNVRLTPHQPRLGFYCSSDEKILRAHIEMAKRAGIDGFIVSFWGKSSQTDKNLLKLMKICEEVKFKFTIYLEDAQATKDLKEELKYIESVYTRSKEFIKLKNRPIIFLFSRVLEKIPLDSLKAIKTIFGFINHGYTRRNLNGFEGFHEYLPPNKSLTAIRQKYRLAAQIVDIENKIMAAPVSPGYDDRLIRKPGNFIARKDGNHYKRLWEAVLETKPDWVLITSFNEWFEGTEIEPSKEYGEFYLELTAHYARLFKKGVLR